jgi:dephospho-CoA kinase
MLTVGLTGGIGSGKSEVAAVLAARGCLVFHADRIARRLTGPGTELLERIVGHFGDGILDRDGAIHRPALGRLVFGDPAKRELLNGIVHPAVIAEEDRLLREAEAKAAGGPCIAVVEAALMLEAGTHGRYHRLVVVHCPPEQQVERLAAARGLSRAEAEARVASQSSTEEKLALAHYTIDSSGTLAETRARAEALAHDLARDEADRRRGSG